MSDLAKRVFEIAKELSVKSKAIVEKCEAEGIPNITNHMSSVSAGLEATIREWFSASEAASGTAVETAERVDLDKVRAPARRKAKKKSGDDADQEDGGGVSVATEEEDASTDAGSVASPGGDDESIQTARPAAKKITPSIPSTTDDVDGPQVGAPVTPAPAEQPVKPDGGDVVAPAETELRPAAKAPAERAPGRAPAQQNIPTRPKVVTPAGPRLEVQTPARLSGPKVVRIEQPDVLPTPRSRGGDGGPSTRGPRDRAGVGPDAPPTEDDAGTRSPRRNKRRGGTPATGGGTDDSARKRRGPQTQGPGWREQDLLEREQRLSRSGGFMRQRRRDQKMKHQGPHSGQRATTAAEKGGTVKVTTPLTIKDLSSATGVKAAEIVKRLFMKGIMSSVNAGIEAEQAQEIMLDFEIVLEVEEKATGEAAVAEQFERRDIVDERPRSPVVTILGHVDHGKTSLLDRIRKANVAEGEAGGITQATSAFLVSVEAGEAKRNICFLDTPGHKAFSEMRSRGAMLTDIVVLVIAADDGVMPQTVESINHAKAAGVPLIVALNKIDIPDAESQSNIQRIYGQLAEHGLNPTEWGGDTEVIRTSAATGRGVQDLLETLAYVAELHELKADFGGAAAGVVIEARLEEGRGPVANILVQHGELKLGDFVVAGRGFGRVRDITDDRGQRIKTAGPSTPAQISGLDTVPDAGDKFYIVSTLKQAQEAAEQRRAREREEQLSQPKVTLDSMFAQMQEAAIKELLVVLKADVQGSVDAIRKSVEEIATDEVKVRVLHAAVGGVTESDVTLAAASRAVILGFNVIPTGKARTAAEQKGVEIRTYQVIYDIVDDMKKAAEGLLAPEIRQEILGHAEVREVFRISKVGSVAGCYVTDGTIERNAMIRVTRDGIVIENDRVLEQLKRFKDDAKEVRSGQECGMKIVGYDDIKEGDILECYRKTEVKRTL